MFNMPNSPSTGNTVAGPGGVQWQWDGTKWIAMAPALNSIALTGNPTAPTPPAGDSSTSIATTAFVQGVSRTGITNGSNAAPGQIGELLSAGQATALSMTTNATLNVVTLSLTPGDWKVYGVATLTNSAAATVMGAGVSSTSATLPTAANLAAGIGALNQLRVSFTAGGPNIFPTGNARVNNSATANVYLVAQATFASGTCTATGYLAARRMR